MRSILTVLSQLVKVNGLHYENIMRTDSQGSFVSWKHCAIHPFADRWSAVGGEKKMANLIGMSQEGKVSTSRVLLLQDKNYKTCPLWIFA